MRTVGWTILVFAFASLASGQIPKGCSAPDKYPNTRLEPKYARRQKFSNNEKVYYSCDDEFTATKGIRTVQCVNGQWSKLSLKCEKISCGNAGDLPNGEFHYEGNTYIGEKVYAVCNEGYVLKGPLNYMICKKSGWAGELPSCEEEQVTCSAPAVVNSVQRGGDVSVYWVGNNLTVTCSEGFQLDGAQLITCDPSGQWQPQPPRCVPSPDDKIQPAPAGSCPTPTIYDSNAHLADRFITKTSFSSGEKVYYVCDVGYTPAGGRKSRICNNGKWTPLVLKCQRKPCGSAGEILNGWIVYSGVEFGDTATAICDDGFIRVGQATRHCMSNGWNGRNPVCEAVVCEDPPEVTNAIRSGIQDEAYRYKNAVRYRCRVGTLVGEKEIWCTKNGTWSAPAPECKEITCPSPNVPNAYWTGKYNQRFQYRATISIECNVGYVMTGPRTVFCERDGRWVPALPKCQRRSRPVNRRG